MIYEKINKFDLQKFLMQHMVIAHLKGPDHKASLDPENFKKMCDYIRTSEKMIGKNEKFIQNCEKRNIKIAKKNIVAKKNINKGEKFSLDNLTAKRPFLFLSPNRIDQLIKTKAKKNYKANEIIKL